ncbi:MAG: hypothetical protein CMJ75_08925 [Planctomycetaceae bacterium]|nr:hypothetical protein [Planctomycetaceae bacterium]
MIKQEVSSNVSDRLLRHGHPPTILEQSESGFNDGLAYWYDDQGPNQATFGYLSLIFPENRFLESSGKFAITGKAPHISRTTRHSRNQTFVGGTNQNLSAATKPWRIKAYSTSSADRRGARSHGNHLESADNGGTSRVIFSLSMAWAGGSVGRPVCANLLRCGRLAR